MQSPLQIDLPFVMLLFIILLVSGSLLTGLLPAIYISRFAPGLVLKGKNQVASDWTGRLKNYLVVLQFTISVILIIGTITIYRQVSFMRHHDLGFDMDGVMVLDGPRIIKANSFESYMKSLESFKNDISCFIRGQEILQLPQTCRAQK